MLRKFLQRLLLGSELDHTESIRCYVCIAKDELIQNLRERLQESDKSHHELMMQLASADNKNSEITRHLLRMDSPVLSPQGDVTSAKLRNFSISSRLREAEKKHSDSEIVEKRKAEYEKRVEEIMKVPEETKEQTS